MRVRILVVVAVVLFAALFGLALWNKTVAVSDRSAVIALPSASPREAGETPSRLRLPVESPGPSRYIGGRVKLKLQTLRPARYYLEPLPDDGSDAVYGRIVASLGQNDVSYDRHLSRAAREYAVQLALWADNPPEVVMAFLLHSAAAPDSTAAQYIVHTTSDSPQVVGEAVLGSLKSAPRGRGVLRIGVGEAATPGEFYARHVVVFLTRRVYEIDPAARSAPLGSSWRLQGRLPPDYHDLQATVLSPDNSMATFPVEINRRDFSLVVPVGQRRGTVHVGIDGVGNDGPSKILQLTVEAGAEPSAVFEATVPATDPSFQDSASAEEYALLLLNDDRRRFGLPPLQHDPGLAAVARAHSEEMRNLKYFGHLSPVTGLAGDRLAAAGYRSTAHAENVATNDALGEAQASFLASVGHRRFILSDAYTHVGIGLARRVSPEGLTWYLTQLIAKRVVPLDVVGARARLLRRINRARVAAGAARLALDTALTAAAQRGARQAAAFELGGLAGRVAQDAHRVTRSRFLVSAHVAYDLDRFTLPQVTADPVFQSVGIGVFQSETDLHGRTGVVFVVSEEESQ